MTGQKPLKTIAAGSCRAAIWENSIQVNGSSKKVLKASVERRYRDNKDGTWKSSSSFSRNEIPLALYCLEKAFEAIVEEEKGDNGNGVAEEMVSE